VRGGSWNDNLQNDRAANCGNGAPDNRHLDGRAAVFTETAGVQRCVQDRSQ
jgi:hypothetical protein